MAWLNSPHLPIFGSGKNIIPVIHVDSLSSIIRNIIDDFPEKMSYIVAMDPQTVTLNEVAKVY